MTTTSPTPDAILQTAFGFWNSKVLLTAVTFDLFTVLGQGRLTALEIGKKLDLHPRGVSDFLDALVAMKFVEREGDGADAKYYNTPATALYLDRNSPRYIGGIPEMLDARLFKYWNDLPEALRTGKPQNETKHGGKNIFDFSRFRSVCDVGGATGLRSIEVAKKHPHIEGISFDLPPVEPVAKKHIAAAGLTDRIRTATGDFFHDPLPKADVITMGMILHDWNLEKKMKLIRAAYEALPPGGAFIAVEALIDNARRENVFGLLMSLNMLIEFGDAFDYSAADFEKWCSEVGFKRFDVLHLAGPSSAAIAYK